MPKAPELNEVDKPKEEQLDPTKQAEKVRKDVSEAGSEEAPEEPEDPRDRPSYIEAFNATASAPWLGYDLEE